MAKGVTRQKLSWKTVLFAGAIRLGLLLGMKLWMCLCTAQLQELSQSSHSHDAGTGSKWTLLHNNLKNVEFRKKKSISIKCFFFHLFHQQINYCVFNMTDFLYVLWYSTDFAGAVLVQTNIASIQSFLRPGLYVFAEPYCLLSANMCSSFQENSRPWSQCISKIVGYITYK